MASTAEMRRKGVVAEVLERGFGVTQSYLASVNKAEEVTTVAASLDNPPSTGGGRRGGKGGLPPPPEEQERPPGKRLLKRRARSIKRKSDLLGLRTSRGQKYEDYEGLHSMWLDYVTKLVRVTPGRPLGQPCDVILKADLHGCRLRVAQHCQVGGREPGQGLVGLEGIVIKETQNMFLLMCRDDRVRAVPKKGGVFSFDLGDKRFHLVGDNFQTRPVLRTTKGKKATMDIPDHLINLTTLRVMLKNHNKPDQGNT